MMVDCGAMEQKLVLRVVREVRQLFLLTSSLYLEDVGNILLVFSVSTGPGVLHITSDEARLKVILVHRLELGLEDVHEVIDWMSLLLLAQSAKVDVRHESKLPHAVQQLVLVVYVSLMLERPLLKELELLIWDEFKVLVGGLIDLDHEFRDYLSVATS